MDSKQLEQLLEKYWNCETSLEEEKQLREYFRGSVPENLKETADLFRYFEAQQSHSVEEADFDAVVRKKIKQQQPQGKSVSMIFNFARIAAGLLVVITAAYFVRQEVRKAYPPEIVDTYSDPKLALEETKKALMMISKSFNKAQKEAGKLKAFNEAEEKLQKQGKTEETI
jgi:hypothetical protein